MQNTGSVSIARKELMQFTDLPNDALAQVLASEGCQGLLLSCRTLHAAWSSHVLGCPRKVSDICARKPAGAKTSLPSDLRDTAMRVVGFVLPEGLLPRGLTANSTAVRFATSRGFATMSDELRRRVGVALLADVPILMPLDDALVVACLAGLPDVAAALLRRGADARCRDDAAARCAAFRDHAQVMSVLVGDGLAASQEFLDLSLRYARVFGRGDTAEVLLGLGAQDYPMYSGLVEFVMQTCTRLNEHRTFEEIKDFDAYFAALDWVVALAAEVGQLVEPSA
jgi:hypothetical protein